MIVVIGEALIDLIESKAESGSYQAVVGGANANVAIASSPCRNPAATSCKNFI
jgi:sugar/nucleoside kinase (ribokinase family)